MKEVVALRDKVYQREQNIIADTTFKRQQRRDHFDSVFSKVLPAFVAKVQRIDNTPDADYPFPLNGSDMVASFNGRREYAWYLTGSHQGPVFVYILRDGTLVSRKDLYDSTVSPFSFARVGGDELVEKAIGTIKKYLKVKDPHIKPIAIDRRPTALQRQLSEFRYQ